MNHAARLPARVGTPSFDPASLTRSLAELLAVSDDALGLAAAARALGSALGAEAYGVAVSGEITASHGPLPLRRVARREVRRPTAAIAAARGDRAGFSLSLEIASTPVRMAFVRRFPCYSADEIELAESYARSLAAVMPLCEALTLERAQRQQVEDRAALDADHLASLRQAQGLLEELSALQQTIARQDSLGEVFTAIVDGAHRLIGDEVVALRLCDAEDPGTLVAVAWRGVRADVFRSIRRAPGGEGASGLAYTRESLVVIDDYSKLVKNPSRLADGVASAMAVPVREHGAVIGSLVVASRVDGRSYTPAEQETFLAFADHASLALSAARAVDIMQHAFTDLLTGLPNRALFLDRLEHELARGDRDNTDVAVLFLDLDRFKVVNDSLGHAAGDHVLGEVAARLQACVRSTDTVARLGGDEFAVLLGGNGGVTRARATARRIIAALGQPLTVSGREVFLQASVGIAIGRNEASDLLRNADVAMYTAKTQAAGRFEIFEPTMHEQIMKRLELEADLRHAVERGELRLCYQPIVELQTSRLQGVEALLRWHHPHKGLVMPSQFIPVAEETGLIVPIGRWVLQEACQQLASWRHNSAGAPAWVSVNLAAGQLRQAALVEDVRTTLQAAALPPNALVLEITETAAAEDVDAVARLLRRLRQLGVRIAIDDFGTGYSSLRYLKRLPVDILKIAKPFVDDLGSPQGRGLVKAIIDLGESLNLATVAEGIETETQRNTLLTLGTDLGQGYHLGRPLEAHSITDSLARRTTKAT
jgi:diguanylate cyclase (GGDEF)-like protein